MENIEDWNKHDEKNINMLKQTLNLQKKFFDYLFP